MGILEFPQDVIPISWLQPEILDFAAKNLSRYISIQKFFLSHCKSVSVLYLNIMEFFI